MPRRFATVKWVDGEDEGKITVGIPIEHILRFDYEEFLSENFDPEEVFVVQWRFSNKEPPGGWPTYDAVVLDVRGTIGALERNSGNYVFPKSPRVVFTPLRALDGQPRGSRQRESQASPSEQNRKKRKVAPVVEDDSSEEDNPASGRGNNDQIPVRQGKDGDRHEVDGERRQHDRDGDQDDQHRHQEDDDQHREANQNDPVVNYVTPRRNMEPMDDLQLQRNPQNRREENVRARAGRLDNRDGQLRVPRAHDEDGGMNHNFAGRLAGIENLLGQIVRNIPRQQPEQNNPHGVEIGLRGSDVRVSQIQWNAAKDQRSFTAMALSLVMSLFPMNILLISNVKGGKNKIRRPDENPPIHQALDRHIYEAIEVTVRNHFPATFKRAEMTRAVNVKLNKLRREARLAIQAAAPTDAERNAEARE